MTETWTEMRPVHGAPPSLGWSAPVGMSSQRVCGHEYYEASDLGGDMQFCAICDSNGAVGRCAIDHRMVCGYHSKMVDGKRICDECVARREAAARTAAAAAAEAKDRQANEKRSEAVRMVASLADPADRLLALLLLRGAHVSAEALASARRSLPSSLQVDTDDESKAWAALVRNWAESGRLRQRTAVVLDMVEYRNTLITKPMKRIGRINGWKILGGSPSTTGIYGRSGDPDRYVLTDGTVAKAPHGKHVFTAAAPRDSVRLYLRALFNREPATVPDFPAPLLEVVRQYAPSSLA